MCSRSINCANILSKLQKNVNIFLKVNKKTKITFKKFQLDKYILIYYLIKIWDT
jgi:hypothetical protein